MSKPSSLVPTREPASTPGTHAHDLPGEQRRWEWQWQLVRAASDSAYNTAILEAEMDNRDPIILLREGDYGA